MRPPHDVLFWAHFISAAFGVVVYLGMALIFRWFAPRSLYRPTCTALCWVFCALAGLLLAHTIAQVVPGMEAVLSYVDIGTRVVIAAAAVAIFLDTRRRPFDQVRL